MAGPSRKCSRGKLGRAKAAYKFHRSYLKTVKKTALKDRLLGAPQSLPFSNSLANKKAKVASTTSKNVVAVGSHEHEESDFQVVEVVKAFEKGVRHDPRKPPLPGLPGLSLGEGGFPGVCHNSLPGGILYGAPDTSSSCLVVATASDLPGQSPVSSEEQCMLHKSSQSPHTTTANSKRVSPPEASICSRCWPLGAAELGVCICDDLALVGLLPR